MLYRGIFLLGIFFNFCMISSMEVARIEPSAAAAPLLTAPFLALVEVAMKEHRLLKKVDSAEEEDDSDEYISYKVDSAEEKGDSDEYASYRASVCKICNISFACRSYFRHHLAVHNGTSKYRCKYCDKQCASRSNLTHHMKHHNREDRREKLRGDDSEAVLRHSLQLYRNISEQHSGIKPKCPVCHKKYSNKSNLYAHMRNVHECEES